MADNINKEVVIDNEKLNRIKIRIYNLENQNLLTNKYTKSEMVEEIKKLAKQYEQFEQLISSIVEQMSHIAEEDIKVMKGFLNG